MDFEKPLIMGVLNLTPDSFSDGGKFNSPEQAAQRIEVLMAQGADIIDVGGESTGPGAPEVSETEELERVKPVIDWVAKNQLTQRMIFSLDTYKSGVAEYALEHGFQMINDVTALRGDPKMLELLLKYQPYVVLMYSKDPTARTTKADVDYGDVVDHIKSFLAERVSVLVGAGFPKGKIIVDPGMGAFVSGIPKYSFEIIERLNEFKSLDFPVLVGISRKSCLGGNLEERDQRSVEWSLKAVQNGASIIRIHDVSLFKKALAK